MLLFLLINAVNFRLLRLKSSGIITYFERKWIPVELDSRINEHNWRQFHPVEYAHIHIISLGMIYMMIISALICIFENIWYFYKKSLDQEKLLHCAVAININNKKKVKQVLEQKTKRKLLSRLKIIKKLGINLN